MISVKMEDRKHLYDQNRGDTDSEKLTCSDESESTILIEAGSMPTIKEECVWHCLNFDGLSYIM